MKKLIPTLGCAAGLLIGGGMGAAVGAIAGSESIVTFLYAGGAIAGALIGSVAGSVALRFN